jgi:hypothetical protein
LLPLPPPPPLLLLLLLLLQPFVFPKAAASSAGTNSAGAKNWKGYWYTMVRALVMLYVIII